WLVFLKQLGKGSLIVAIVSYQIFSIFILHFILIYPGKYIHRPAKYLLNLAVLMSSKQKLRYQLRLNYLIQVLHTTNRYGITYSSFGLITLKTFVKVFYLKII